MSVCKRVDVQGGARALRAQRVHTRWVGKRHDAMQCNRTRDILAEMPMIIFGAFNQMVLLP